MTGSSIPILMNRMARAGRLGMGAVLNLVLPLRCLKCGGFVETPQALCSDCWRAIRFLAPPWCACCGRPFAFDEGPRTLCAACVASPPRFDRARAVMAYDDAARPLILALKHGDRQHAVPAFGRWMARVGADLLSEADILVPVPLHWTRLFARRYNQSALLCFSIGKAMKEAGNTPPLVVPDLLRRHRRTPSQGLLSRQQRAVNVRGAFGVVSDRDLRGRRIVLVDDVLTTGATVTECVRVLKRHGAVGIDVLTLARAGYEE